VDDDPNWRFIVKERLEVAGFAVVTAANATEALVATDFRFDLIILDLDLAGENGFTLLKFLKLNYPKISFLLYSGLPSADVAAQTDRCVDVQPYLRKGTMEDLLVGVRAALWQKPTAPDRVSQGQTVN